ncbi:uncharacterized protein LOC110226562 [Arabidopsis lyrata subsp. lyrata]|uniref:uncharacterized protein LOC110226562 n=1 Tax=Arabidopsis lyrata subsp. lyrata TaxID=81972 RepID=UPI000A29D00F|nr:uncharacterized protein LOC110226562 [Arabidopsis lyrata subsp. lyrata]|eukprot:XP_020874165.1 uncharacterized protein LOC110226562 [Arabidopsis lyrata subsp. lyrata]
MTNFCSHCCCQTRRTTRSRYLTPTMEIEKLIKIHTDAERLSQETTTTTEHEHITFELYGPSLVLDFQHQQVKRGKRNKLWIGLES